MVSYKGELPDDVVAEAAELERRFALLHLAIDARLETYEDSGITAAQRTELQQAGEHIDKIMTIGAVALEAIDESEFDEALEADTEIDEDEVYDIVKRFFGRRTDGFTANELRQHLFGLGIAMPDSDDMFDQLFANWRAEVIADRKEAGRRSTWLPAGKRERQPVYILADVVTESDFERAQAADRAAKEAAARQRAAARPSAPELKTDAPQEPTDIDIAVGLITEHGNEAAGKLVERLAEQQQISVPEASQLYERLQAEGRVYRIRTKGRSYFSLQPAERRSRENTTAKNAVRHELTPEQKQHAALILRALSGAYTYVTKPLTPQEIIRTIGELQPEHTVTVDGLKTIALQLQRQGLVVRTQARQGTKRAKAKRLEVMKIGVKNQAVMKQLKTPAGMAKARAAIESGQPFEPTEDE